jgi:DUF4097 and DUF4098 domain-containing protein YvlB
MKKTIYLFLAVIISTATFAQQSGTPYITRSLSKENIKEVLAKTSGGGIFVSGVTGSEARLEVYINGNNGRDLTKDEIKQRLDDDYKLTLSVEGGKLTVIAEPKSFNMNWKKALNIAFDIYVPQNISTDLNTSGGGIKLKNLSGTHMFATSGGGLNINKLTGRVRGKTSGGGISVSDSGGEIDLSTSGGGIDASNCSGSIRLNTSGGPINLQRLDGTIEAETSGGSVRGNTIKGELTAHTSGGGVSLLELSCSVKASTSGGNMDIQVDQLGKYVNVSNSGGNITVKLPANKGLDLKLRGERIRTTNLNNFSGEQEDNRITGKINGGGVPIDIHTSGSINLALQ